MHISIFATQVDSKEYRSYKTSIEPGLARELIPALSERSEEEYVGNVVVVDVIDDGGAMWSEMELTHNHEGKELVLCRMGILDVNTEKTILSIREVYNIEGMVDEGCVEIILMKSKDKIPALLLSKKEMETISYIAIDQATGNHLIRPRTGEYLEEFSKVMKLLNSGASNEKEQQIIDYFHACSDPKLYDKFIEKYTK